MEDIKSAINLIDDDRDREKSTIIDANSNEKRLKEEKKDLIETDSKYYETEKNSNDDLTAVKTRLNENIEKIRNLISLNQNKEALILLDDFKEVIELYAESYGKNKNIKKESIKREQRIKIIDTEIESWVNLLKNSQNKINELEVRKKQSDDKLLKLENQPQSQAEKKGKISEMLRISEGEKSELDIKINDLELEIKDLRNKLNSTKESSIEIR